MSERLKSLLDFILEAIENEPTAIYTKRQILERLRPMVKKWEEYLEESLDYGDDDWIDDGDDAIIEKADETEESE